MSTALILLISLVGATPIIVIIDGPIVYAVLAATSAAGVAVAARAIRPGEAGHFLTLIRPVAILAAVPAIWMLIQILPLKILGLSNPIWESAASALGYPINGGISIDPGATIICLIRYLSMIVILLLAAAVAIDRTRAEYMLIVLTAAATLIAIMVIIDDLGRFLFLSTAGSALARSGAVDCAALGLLFSAASGIRVFERYETQRTNSATSLTAFAAKLGACVACFALNCFAIALYGTGPLIFAVCYGVATLAIVVAIRRLGLGPWGWSGIAASAILIAIAVVLTQSGIRSTDLSLAFAGSTPAWLMSITERILADSTWTGTGAGTFAALLPIYQDVHDVVHSSNAPTIAAAIIVEFGRPALWALVIIASVGMAVLLRAALRRGRDSFYAATGAASVLVLTVLAFTNAGIFNSALSTLAAVALGLAFAQIQSRSLQ